MKNHDQLFNKTKFKNFRKHLRNNLTPAEATLWRYLKNKQIDGRRFRRQFGVDKYVLDFYCPSENLAVELDGEDHFSDFGLAYDSERELFLRQYNIQIIRFENQEVFENIEFVIERIRKCFIKS